jgi:addiction module RelE/StbE family toxin
MVVSAFHDDFKKIFNRIKDKSLKEKLIKQLAKIRENPEIGKPMMYTRKGTREIHISPYRLSYIYLKDEEKIIFLDLYHKDKQ